MSVDVYRQIASDVPYWLSPYYGDTGGSYFQRVGPALVESGDLGELAPYAGPVVRTVLPSGQVVTSRAPVATSAAAAVNAPAQNSLAPVLIVGVLALLLLKG